MRTNEHALHLVSIVTLARTLARNLTHNEQDLLQPDRRLGSSAVGYLAIVLVAFGSTAAADERINAFFAEGEIHSDTTLTFKGKPIPSTATQFQVTQHDSNWHIRTERNLVEAGTGMSATLRVLVGCIDGDIFSASYRRPAGTTNWSCIAGSARTGPVPYVMLEPSIQMLWVTFIAQGKYNVDGRHMLPAIYFPYEPRLYDATFSMPADIAHNDTPPYSISKLTVYLDKWRYWDEPLDALITPPLERPLPSPYREGCTNFTYAVAEFSNGGAWSWPSKFAFTFYGMKNGATNAGDLRLIGSSHGTVTEFRTDSNANLESFVPSLPPGVIVTEGRFIGDKDPVRPFISFSRGAWQSKAEIVQSQEYLREKQRQNALRPAIQSRPHPQAARGQAGARRYWVWAAILASTAFAIFLLLKTRNTSQT